MLCQALCKLTAVHARHDHIGEEQMDRLFQAGAKVHGCFGVFGNMNQVPCFLQDDAHQFPHNLFVFHHKNSFFIAPRCFLATGFRLGMRFFIHLRQVDGKACSAAGVAFNRDVAVTLLDDAVHGRKAETGALARRFRGVERLEYAGHGFTVHAAAVIADRERNISSGAHRTVLVDASLVKNDICRADLEGPAIGHGIPGIYRKVDDDLLQLSRVSLYSSQARIFHGDERDIFTDESAEDPVDVGDDFVEIDHFRLQQLAAAEGQQLAGECGSALAGFSYFLYFLQERRIISQAIDEQIAIAGNDSQQVVEIMRDSSGKPSDGLHFLCLPEMLDHLQFFGGVQCIADTDPDYRRYAGQKTQVQLQQRLFHACVVNRQNAE